MKTSIFAVMITEMLQSGRSKAQINLIVQWIGADPDRLALLMDVLRGTDRKLAEYAAWVVGTIGQKQPLRFEPWYPEMVALLHNRTVHPAVHRNILRIFIQSGPPASVFDSLTEACFIFLDDPQSDIAIRAFSIHILAKICKKEPELWTEFKHLLELHTPHGSAGLRGIGKKYLDYIAKHGL